MHFFATKLALFWVTSTAITLSGTEEVLQTHVGKKYISSYLFLLNNPDKPTFHYGSSDRRLYPAISIAPFFLYLSCYAMWFMTWIQNISLFFLLSLLLCSPARMRNKFQFFCRRNFLFTSSAAAFFTSSALNAPKSSFPFGRVQHQG